MQACAATTTPYFAHQSKLVSLAPSPTGCHPPRPIEHRFAPHKLTCDEVIAQAARDHTQVYLGLLPQELRAHLDRKVHTPSWHWQGEYVRVSLPPLGTEPWFSLDYAIKDFKSVVSLVWQKNDDRWESVVLCLGALNTVENAQQLPGSVRLLGAETQNTMIICTLHTNTFCSAFNLRQHLPVAYFALKSQPLAFLYTPWHKKSSPSFRSAAVRLKFDV